MREIKFRAWDKEYNMMDYEPGKTTLIGFDGNIYEEVERSGFGQRWDEYEKVDNYVLMQYTGLKINDKEIYEHDVMMIIAEDENGKEIGREKCVVDFDRQAFVFAPSLKHRGLTQDALFKRYKASYLRWELLGNIYENPELIADE